MVRTDIALPGAHRNRLKSKQLIEKEKPKLFKAKAKEHCVNEFPRLSMLWLKPQFPLTNVKNRQRRAKKPRVFRLKTHDSSCDSSQMETASSFDDAVPSSPKNHPARLFLRVLDRLHNRALLVLLCFFDGFEMPSFGISPDFSGIGGHCWLLYLPDG